jgi:hypothetical protein
MDAPRYDRDAHLRAQHALSEEDLALWEWMNNLPAQQRPSFDDWLREAAALDAAPDDVPGSEK